MHMLQIIASAPTWCCRQSRSRSRRRPTRRRAREVVCEYVIFVSTQKPQTAGWQLVWQFVEPSVPLHRFVS